jgi:hypothetical protein
VVAGFAHVGSVPQLVQSQIARLGGLPGLGSVTGSIRGLKKKARIYGPFLW